MEVYDNNLDKTLLTTQHILDASTTGNRCLWEKVFAEKVKPGTVPPRHSGDECLPSNLVSLGWIDELKTVHEEWGRPLDKFCVVNAVENGDLELVRYLLRKNASVKRSVWKILFQDCPPFKREPIFDVLVHHGQVDMVEVLFRLVKSIDGQWRNWSIPPFTDTWPNNSPPYQMLHQLCSRYDVDGLRTVDTICKGTLLHAAAEGSAVWVLKYLVEERNAALDSKDTQGRTPLMRAVKRGNTPAISYLLSKGANAGMNHKSINSLMLAAKKGLGLASFLVAELKKY